MLSNRAAEKLFPVMIMARARVRLRRFGVGDRQRVGIELEPIDQPFDQGFSSSWCLTLSKGCVSVSRCSQPSMKCPLHQTN